MPAAPVRRRVSIALAAIASVLLLTGLVVPGLMMGLAAVTAAWVRSPAPPIE